MARASSSYANALRQRVLWTPEMLLASLPFYWWDASDPGSFLLDAASRPTQWTDRIRGMTLTPAQVEGPIWQGDRFWFETPNKGLITPGHWPITSSQFTLVLQMQLDAYSGLQAPRVVGWKGPSAEDYNPDGVIALLVSNPIICPYHNGIIATQGPLALGQPAIVAVTYNMAYPANAVGLRINGVEQARSVTDATLALDFGQLLVGISTDLGADESFLGRMGDLLWCWGALVPAELERLEGYLAHKWRIRLAAGHAYADRAPTVTG